MDYDFGSAIEALVAETLLFIPNLIVAIIIFIATLLIANLGAKAVKNAVERRETDPELGVLLCRITKWVVIIIGTIWALDQVNFNVAGFVAGLGIIGFTIGFALKDVAENFVAGILLLIRQPFDIGDAIEVNGYAGIVTDIEVRDTTLRTWDGLLLIVPNAKVYTNAITNYTKVERRRLELVVGVGYETDLQQAHNIMIDVVTAMPGIIADDPAPVVVFNEFGDSAINATLYYWYDTQKTDYWSAQDGAVKGIKTAFEQAGINIPFPIRTIYMPQEAT